MDFRSPVQAVIPGAQGKILAVLASAGAPLNLRTVGDLVGVSVGQTSRVLVQLVALGLVDRTDIPPVALFRLQDRNLASRLVSQLAQLREDFFEQVTRSARSIEPAPINVTVFGSMARGQAGAESDIDLLVVRASDTEADDDLWVKSLGMFEEELEALAGNPPNLIEVAEGEMPELLGGKEGLWKQVEEEGLVLLGVPLAKFQNGNG